MTDLNSNPKSRFEIKPSAIVSESKITEKRCSLDKLLEGVTLESVRVLVKETAWAREGVSVGKEIL